MQIKIINKSQHPLPNYETNASAGMDLRANLTESITLKPLERTLVKQDFLSNYQLVLKHKFVQEVDWHSKKELPF